jgi:hypothetical protein
VTLTSGFVASRTIGGVHLSATDGLRAVRHRYVEGLSDPAVAYGSSPWWPSRAPSSIDLGGLQNFLELVPRRPSTLDNDAQSSSVDQLDSPPITAQAAHPVIAPRAGAPAIQSVAQIGRSERLCRAQSEPG